LPKQFLPLAGKPLLRHCLETFAAHPRIAGVKVVINDSYRALYDSATAGLPLLAPALGGETRQASVHNGLESLTGDPPDLVLIHDAARPFIDAPTIDRTIDALADHDGALVAVQVVDTLKRAEGKFSGETVDRAGLWRAQTPQGFRFQPILAAHRKAAAGPEMTDDAAVAEAAGIKVVLVPGIVNNFKVTTRADFERAEHMMAEHRAATPLEYRTGSGYDVHRLVEGDGVWMCGVLIPHNQKLEGHSDADVAMHALTDAILGAIAAQDIGAHFPPSDPQWRGAPSWKFLDHAMKLRHHHHLRAAEGRPASRGYDRAPRRDHGDRCASHQREGHHHREARLHRPQRRHRRPGDGHGRLAALLTWMFPLSCNAIAISS
jgi:2-C-methyl-D-erythritol 4-phosphate cytidylyltransferase/2-C-methyl-D-erythritol 2,4-cyclodiphosphate synthase